MSPEVNGWEEYKLLVLDTMKRIEGKQDSLSAQVTDLKLDVSNIKTEAQAAKYFGGLVLPATVAIGVSWVSRKLGL